MAGLGLLELVTQSGNSDSLALLLWDGSNAMVSPRIEDRGRTYEPIQIDPSVLRAIVWPRGRRDYGSTQDLYSEVVAVLSQYTSFPEDSVRLLAYFAFSTWFPDRLPVCPSLALFGPAYGAAMQVLRLLRCFCRRPLFLASPTASELLHLPLDLSPTLLMVRPRLNSGMESFLRASSYRGPHVARGSTVLAAHCSKVIFCGTDAILLTARTGLIDVALPCNAQMKILDDESAGEIARELQDKMLAYRLDSQGKAQVSFPQLSELSHHSQELGLTACGASLDSGTEKIV